MPPASTPPSPLPTDPVPVPETPAGSTTGIASGTATGTASGTSTDGRGGTGAPSEASPDGQARAGATAEGMAPSAPSTRSFAEMLRGGTAVADPRATAALLQIGDALSLRQGAGPLPDRLVIELDPPDLGRIEIGFDIGEQGLRATLTAERAATGDLLRRHGEALVQHLQEAGFSEVDLRHGDRGDGERGHTGAGGSAAGGPHGRSRAAGPGGMGPADPGAVPDDAPGMDRRADVGLDLRF